MGSSPARPSQKWTVVQHSGFLTGHFEFEHAVEEAFVPNVGTERAIERVGGVLFDDYQEASGFAEAANYPPGVNGLVPHARGTFAPNVYVGQRRVYIPVREVAH